jgi:hypothetical protein
MSNLIKQTDWHTEGLYVEARTARLENYFRDRHSIHHLYLGYTVSNDLIHGFQSHNQSIQHSPQSLFCDTFLPPTRRYPPAGSLQIVGKKVMQLPAIAHISPAQRSSCHAKCAERNRPEPQIKSQRGHKLMPEPEA